MKEDKDYSLQLKPGMSTKYVAGQFDVKTGQQHYDIEMVIAWRWGFVLMQLKRA